jgi:general secretion pathway protein D
MTRRAAFRPVNIGVQPLFTPNPASNTIVAKASVSMMEIAARIIQLNDKPPAEVVIDVEILEVNRNRAKTYGLNLSEFALGGVFSPEVRPGATGAPTAPGADGTGGSIGLGSTPPSGVQSPPPFNVNTISRGISSSDFYLAVPTAIVRFLESDTQTKLAAKPQLRQASRCCDARSAASTTFTLLATGGGAQSADDLRSTRTLANSILR